MGFKEDFGIFFSRTFSSLKNIRSEWPYVPGKYFVLNPDAPVAVTTLGSVNLAGELASAAPEGLCISGKVETENIGIEKIVKNIISNTSIRYLLCTGAEPPKHMTGASLLALFKNGMDGSGRIIEAPGVRPVLKNTSPEEIELLRRQVEVINMIGCTEIHRIGSKVAELAARVSPEGREFRPEKKPYTAKEFPRIIVRASFPDRIHLDKGGYFVILIDGEKILVEHYDYRDRLMHVIEGNNAGSLYRTLIKKGWVTQLDHAAYLGRELARAEMSIKNKTDFTQDGA